MKSHAIAIAAAVMCTAVFTTGSGADPIDVTYTVSGSSGNYTLNFSVKNNLGNTNAIYFFGVELSQRNITGFPVDWNSNVFELWDNGAFGGSSTMYNNNWINFTEPSTQIQPGATLSGFASKVTDLTEPMNIHWFAYALGGSYDGPGCFKCDEESPGFGFEGIANASAAAVPGPIAGVGLPGLMLAAGGMLGYWRRRRPAPA